MLPGIGLADSPVAVAWWGYREATSIAVNLSHFVAGRLAYIDIADPVISLEDEECHALIELSAQFGDTFSARRVLDAIEPAHFLPDIVERMSALFGAVDPDDPLSQIISAAHAKSGTELMAWLNRAIHEYQHEVIVERLWLSRCVSNRSDADLSETAWRLICGDDVFDPNYTGQVKGPAYGVYMHDAMVRAIR